MNASSPTAPPLRPRVERHHVVNTLVGVLDSAFDLTGEEQLIAIDIVGKLLDLLLIPDRGQPNEIPAALMLELEGEFYSSQLCRSSLLDDARRIRPATNGDHTVPPSTWRAALLRMLTHAYPDLTATERLLAAKAFDGLLSGIGVPQRAPTHVPEVVFLALADS